MNIDLVSESKILTGVEIDNGGDKIYFGEGQKSKRRPCWSTAQRKAAHESEQTELHLKSILIAPLQHNTPTQTSRCLP